MEIIKYPPADSEFRYVLFDFDGTLSLIREGWQEIMIPYFIEVLLETPGAESKEVIEEIVTLFVDRLTGKQTIFQCMRLDDEVVMRGGVRKDPGLYKNEYLRRLDLHTKNRINELQDGCDPQKYLVPGSAELLKLLQDKGCEIYLASGTDEADVIKEARLLGLDKYFGERIYGAHDDMTDCSKEAVIKKIISDNSLSGAEFLSLGDGFVEIELSANVGGYAIGVATDEVRKKGVNARKRERLLEAGADLIIPDFNEPEKLLSFLF
ncbi:MAG: HAD hydrolase-like protein [Oscillospiraceae bacterium]|jgi:phosphoglycolate phosphatase-like HAD superfamily hydrolase|nr:HAD hydrolase-like protein [Oscillospiraceae bacterium]